MTERQIIRMLKEEHQRFEKERLQEIDLSPYPGQSDDDPLLSPNLKVRHKKTNLLYTIVEVGLREIVLEAGDGTRFAVDEKTFEKEYELD